MSNPFFARVFPFYTKIMEKLAYYADLKKDPREHVNFIVIVGLVLGVIGFIAGFIFLNWYLGIVIFISAFILVLLVAYLLLMLKADSRGSDAEKVLPDALQLMATNLRAGLTTDKAFLVSAREEFGVLNEEFKRVAKEIAAGKDLVDSLHDMSKRIKSDTISRTIDLITFGMTSGGELAPLLEESASSLRQQLLTRKQVHASVLMYTIFIFAAVGFIAPLLFGLSTVLTGIMTSTLGSVGEIPKEVTASVPISVASVMIDINFIRGFAIVLLLLSGVLSSLVLGLINSGEEKDGLKYIPILVPLSIAMYFLTSFGVKFILSTFVGAG